MSVFTVDLYFVHNGEFDIIVLVHKLFYLLVSSWFLAFELIAWEGQNLEPLIFEIFSQLIQLFVIWICVATLACHINYQNGLALLEFRKQIPVSINIFYLHVVKRSRRGLNGLFLDFFLLAHFYKNTII